MDTISRFLTQVLLNF